LTPPLPQTKGKTLYFSHGFSVVFAKDTGVVVPDDIDVILCAPKGSGRTVRTLFKEGRGINSSIAVWQDVTGKVGSIVRHSCFGS
jgi:ketol-acid reductoisomerase